MQILALDSKGAGDSGYISALTGFSAGSDAYAVVFGRTVTLYDCGTEQFVDLTQCATADARRAEIAAGRLYLAKPTEKTSFSTVSIETLELGTFQAGNFGASGKIYKVEVLANASGTLRVRAGGEVSVCLRASVLAEVCLARSEDDGEAVYAVSSSPDVQNFYAEVGAGAQFVRGEFYANLAENASSVT